MVSIVSEWDGILAKDDGWDFPIEELPYLLDEHDGETFIYSNGRLYEAEEER